MQFKCNVKSVCSKTKTVQLEEEPQAIADGAFDLICACDGKGSKVRSSIAQQDLSLVVTEVKTRSGEQTYKTFNCDVCNNAQDDLHPGWLYTHPHVDGPAVVARMPSGGAVGIIPMPPNKVAAGVPPGLLYRRVPGLLKYITMTEAADFEQREWADASGGFIANQLHAGGFVALIGDAACSPPPPGQGINHAFEAAACLVEHLSSDLPVADALLAYSSSRMADEEAYAFLAKKKTVLEVAACGLGILFGMHTAHLSKDSSAPYRDATVMHKHLRPMKVLVFSIAITVIYQLCRLYWHYAYAAIAYYFGSTLIDK